MNRVMSIILGGGRGTRLYPLTEMRAKPAVPIAGRYRLIDIPVSNSINSGIDKIDILTQFNSASLNRHITKTYSFSPFSKGFVEILAAQQTPDSSNWFQGTADAVRQYLGRFKNMRVDQYLLLSGDHLYQMDYKPFIDHHRDTEADITLSVVPVSRDKASEFGLIKIDENGAVLEFSEKPKGEALDRMAVDTTVLGLSPEEAKEKPFIASMGIYVFNKDAMIDLLERDPRQIDFGKEVLPSAIATHKVQAYLFNQYWEDIGTIEAFYEANLNLIHYPNRDFHLYNAELPLYTRPRFLPPSKIKNATIEEAMLCDGCIIEKCKIKNSVIGVRSRISPNAEITDTLVMGADFSQTVPEMEEDIKNGKPPVGIGENAVIKKAIIDKNARIGKNVKIINKSKIQELKEPEKGYYISGGIVIVMKGAVIPDNTVI